jgi:hypothetical protein
VKKPSKQTKSAVSKTKPAPARKRSAKPAPKARTARTVVPRRTDYDAPIESFFAKQPPVQRSILEALRALVVEAAPDAVPAIRWGMAHYRINGQMFVALAGFKSHVNLIMAGPPSAFDDPEGRLEGEAKGGRHLKLRALEALPKDSVRRWLSASAAAARRSAAE